MGLLDRFKKAESDSLDDVIDEVRTAWRTQYDTDSWVSEVYADHVIVCNDTDYWSVDYVEDEGAETIAFDVANATQVERAWTPVGKTFEIRKVDPDQQLVFGWANVAFEKDGQQIEDSQGDIIDPAELEQTAYLFTLHYREGDEMHTDEVKTHLVESVVFTDEKQEAMGLEKGALPVGWWAGFHVEDDDAWAAVKDGTYQMFSIGGLGQREPVS